MSNSKKQNIWLRNTMMAFVGGSIQSLILLYAYSENKLSISGELFAYYLIIFWLVCFGFVALLLTGVNIKFKDPSMSIAQMFWATFTSFLSLVFLDDFHELIYMQLFTVVVYGIFRLQARQFYNFVYAMIAGFAAVQEFLLLQGDISAWEGVVTWIVFGVCMWTMAMLCVSLVSLRQSLKHKNEELELALSVKSQFLANMSHEIRTPMNGIVGMLNILGKTDLQAEQQQYTRIAQSSADSLLNIINDILDLSKMDAGKLNIESIPFDVVKEVVDSAANFALAAKDKNLHLRISISASVPEVVLGDPLRLRQILSNLISNAIKFTESGGVTVDIFSSEIDDGNYEITMRVTDTGIGISESQRIDLFSPFTQADGSTTRLYGGTGLGLTIVKRICELMHGGVKVESEKGQGSQFTCWVKVKPNLTGLKTTNNERENCLLKKINTGEDVLLDLTDLIGQPDSSSYVSTSSDRLEESKTDDKNVQYRRIPPNTEQTKAKILLVEDNATNLQVARFLLEDLGYYVEAAENGQHAIDQLISSELHFDLILMDCQMPVMDGYQASQKIRNGEAGVDYVDIPIIAQTAHAMDGDREKCLQARMNDYVPKPIDETQLKLTVEHWLSESTNKFNITKSSSGSITKQHSEEDCTWDQNAFACRLGYQEERMKKIVNIFLINLPENVTKLLEAIDKEDTKTLQAAAHNLKGACANISATSLNATMVAIEQAIYSNQALPKELKFDIESKVTELDKSLRAFQNQTHH